MNFNKRYHLWLLLTVVLLQFLVFSRIDIPYNLHIFVYFIYFIALPPLPLLITYIIFFTLGAIIDVSMETPAVNMIASVLVVPFRAWYVNRNVSIHNKEVKKGSPLVSMRGSQLLTFVFSLALVFNIGWYVAYYGVSWIIGKSLLNTLITFSLCVVFIKFYNTFSGRRAYS